MFCGPSKKSPFFGGGGIPSFNFPHPTDWNMYMITGVLLPSLGLEDDTDSLEMEGQKVKRKLCTSY